MDKDNLKGFDFLNTVSVVISPHENGFVCGIVDPKDPADNDICSIIGKGLIRYVTEHPEIIYQEGLLEMAEKESKDRREYNNLDNDDNVVDILNFLNKKDLH
tara:strand:- start:129 stop:434 length:306 start_codon:yes stop_codon:yes gene_type:complete